MRAAGRAGDDSGSASVQRPRRRALEVAARVDRLHAHAVAADGQPAPRNAGSSASAPLAISASGAEHGLAAGQLAVRAQVPATAGRHAGDGDLDAGELAVARLQPVVGGAARVATRCRRRPGGHRPSRSAATDVRGAVISAQTVSEGTVVTPSTAIASTRLAPDSGVTAAAGLGAGAAAGRSWKATSASWIEPTRSRCAEAQLDRLQAPEVDALELAQRDPQAVEHDVAAEGADRGLERGPEVGRPHGRRIAGSVDQHDVEVLRSRSPGSVPLETGLRASAKLTAVRRLSVPNRAASRAAPASCARSVAGPSQASVSWRPKERLVEAVEVPTPFGGHGLDLRARALVAVLVAPVVGRETGSGQLAARRTQPERVRRPLAGSRPGAWRRAPRSSS